MIDSDDATLAPIAKAHQKQRCHRSMLMLCGTPSAAIGDRDFEALTPDELVDLAQAVPPLLPPDLYRRIIEFRRRAPSGDVLLLRGLLPWSAAPP